MQLLATDIGFGSVKSHSSNSIFKFPSAVSMLKSSIIDNTAEKYNFRGIDYLVGEEALRDAYETRDYLFLEKFAPLLLFKAIEEAELDPSSPLKIATGLSLLNWDKKEQFAEVLKDYTINNTRVSKLDLLLLPQGKGIYLDCLKSNVEIQDELVMVIDIGYNTLDIIPFEKGRPLASEAWASTFGVNIMVSELQKYIVKEYGLSLSEAKVNEAYQNRHVKFAGEKRDLSIIIDEEKKKYTDQVMHKVRMKNSDLFNSADTIIIAGGGAYAFEDYSFDRKTLFPKNNYEFSNVRGYFESLKHG